MAKKARTSKISSILRLEFSRITMKELSNHALSLRLEVMIETIRVMITLMTMTAKYLKFPVAMKETTKTLWWLSIEKIWADRTWVADKRATIILRTDETRDEARETMAPRMSICLQAKCQMTKKKKTDNRKHKLKTKSKKQSSKSLINTNIY